MNTVYLAQVLDIDKSYQNVLRFNTASSRLAYFNKKVIYTRDDWGGKMDYDKQSITLRIALTPAVSKVDYLYFEGVDGRFYFYFVDSMSYVNPSTTEFFITLDVWTTYHLDMTLYPSFVERCHVDRWASEGIPNTHMVDEGLPQFEYQIIERTPIAKWGKSFMMVSTDPLGKIGVDVGGGDGPTPGNGTGTYINTDHGTFMVPTTGTVSANWASYTNGSYVHDGIDIAGGYGTAIYSAREGTVTRVQNLGNEAWGYYLDITHDDGTMSRYAHCKTIEVQPQQRVGEGQLIATQGNTGEVRPKPTEENPTAGTHLHWGIYYKGVAIQIDKQNAKMPIGKYISKDMGAV